MEDVGVDFLQRHILDAELFDVALQLQEAAGAASHPGLQRACVVACGEAHLDHVGVLEEGFEGCGVAYHLQPEEVAGGVGGQLQERHAEVNAFQE